MVVDDLLDSTRYALELTTVPIQIWREHHERGLTGNYGPSFAERARCRADAGDGNVLASYVMSFFEREMKRRQVIARLKG